jgi:hypothetical protein
LHQRRGKRGKLGSAKFGPNLKRIVHEVRKLGVLDVQIRVRQIDARTRIETATSCRAATHCDRSS